MVIPYAKIGLAYLLQGWGSSGLQPNDAINVSNSATSEAVSVSKSTVAMWSTPHSATSKTNSSQSQQTCATFSKLSDLRILFEIASTLFIIKKTVFDLYLNYSPSGRKSNRLQQKIKAKWTEIKLAQRPNFLLIS